MTWRIWRWWLAGILAYLVFLVATLPAVYAAGWLQHLVPQIQLTGVSGSIWSGDARELAFSGDAWGQVRWHFDWSSLLSGHPGYRLALHGSGITVSGRVAGDRQRLLLRDIQGHMDIQRLAAWLPLPHGALSGDLQLDLNRVTLLQNRPAAADGIIALTQAVLNWPQSVVLGSYQLKLVTRADSGIQGTLLDTSGPLALQGNVQMKPDGHYAVSGTLASRAAADSTLSKLLRYLPADASGNHRFSFSGQW